MKTFLQWLGLAGLAAALLSTPALAQPAPGGGGPGGPGGPGGRNFDPEQMRARMMERYREQLEVTSDDEWKLIQERIEKVSTARRDAGGMGMGMGRGMQPRRPGGDGENAGPNQRGNRSAFGSASLPEGEELQKALEAKASPDEIKAKLAKYREARKARQAALAKAQDELRAVLSVRQEATAVMMGLLD